MFYNVTIPFNHSDQHAPEKSKFYIKAWVHCVWEVSYFVIKYEAPLKYKAVHTQLMLYENCLLHHVIYKIATPAIIVCGEMGLPLTTRKDNKTSYLCRGILYQPHRGTQEQQHSTEHSYPCHNPSEGVTCVYEEGWGHVMIRLRYIIEMF